MKCVEEKSANEILRGILKSLNESFDFLVLRNFESLPFEWDNDVDILISAGDLKGALSQIMDILSKRGLLARATLMRRYGLTAVKIDCDDRCLRIDLFYVICKGWVSYANPNYVLSLKEPYSELCYVPRPSHVVLLVVAKELFSYGVVREKYRESLLKVDHELLRDEAVGLFGDYISRDGIDVIVDAIKYPGRKRNRFSFAPRLRYVFQLSAMVEWIKGRFCGFGKVSNNDAL